MKLRLTLLFLLTLAGLAPLSAASDSVAVTDHTIVGFGTRVDHTPRAIHLTLEVECLLVSKPAAVLRFAIDRDAEMKFTVVKEEPVTGGKKKQRIKVSVYVEGFSRDTLRGIVLLTDPAAGADAKPLAATGISLDVKKFKNG
jgi:hypothetical protein